MNMSHGAFCPSYISGRGTGCLSSFTRGTVNRFKKPVTLYYYTISPLSNASRSLAQDGQLSRSQGRPVGRMCVITSVSYSGALNAYPRFLTGALVKLCHAVDGLYLSVLPPVLIYSLPLKPTFRFQLGVSHQS